MYEITGLSFLIAGPLIAAGVCCLVVSCITIASDPHSRSRREYLNVGMLLVVYNFCYGFMTIAQSEKTMTALWTIGFITGCMFFPLWLLFLTNMVSRNAEQIRKAIYVIMVVSAALIVLSVLSGGVVFVSTRLGVQFHYGDNIPLKINAVYVLLLGITMTSYHRLWLREAELKRTKHQAQSFIRFVGIIAPAALIAEYIIPAFTPFTAPPLNGLAIVAGSLNLFFSMRRNQALSLTVRNVSEFVYRSVTVPTLILDHKNIINMHNDAAVSFFGRSIVGHNIERHLISTDKVLPPISYENSFEHRIVDVKTPNGIRICDVLLTVEKDEFDEAICKVVLLNDITESEQKKVLLVDALQKAGEARKAKNEFLLNISHEMRTPMNAIIGMTGVARRATDEEVRQQALGKVDEASTHLLGVINNLLDLSQVEADNMVLEPGLLNIEKVMMQALTQVSFSLNEKNHKLATHIDDDIPRALSGDARRLEQVLVILLSNAIKFTPEGGSIRLHIFLTGETDGLYKIGFDVEDSGIGISDGDKKRIFNAFEQAEGGIRREYGGSGVGLAIAKRIIELMGGNIWIESKSGGGTCFRFLIKAARQSEKTGTKAEPAGDSGGNDYSHLAGKRVLIADDIEINCEIIIAILEGTGLIFDCVTNGEEALRAVESPVEYDLVLMDLMMPKMDGIEAARRIRALPDNKGANLPIVAVSANLSSENIDECIEAGMNDHISKPIDAAGLLKIVTRLLSPEDW